MRRLILTLLLGAATIAAQAKRVVILKFDGLPGWYVEKALSEKDPLTGKSRAPWMQHVFAENGVRLLNFYARGISLSVPSWQILDTGQHAIIHGNAEYDRYSTKVYDYLNFFPFYFDYGRAKKADMPSVEVLDEAGLSLLLDRFPYEQRHQSFQLNQRGMRFRTLPKILTNRIASTKAKQLMDEWQAGFSFGKGVYEAMERELVDKLRDPGIRYLDYFSGEFDHQSHLTNDAFSHATVFRESDRLVGRIFTEIEKSPLAEETILAVVSDHGMNTVENTYSQGYNLVDFFTSEQGGSHHVVTNRYLLQEYKLMGLDPFVNRVITPSDSSPYLKGQHKRYPTVLLDLDGNERASIHFRNNALNRLHMVLLQLQDRPKQLAPLAMSIVDSRREKWTKELGELRTESLRLTRLIATNPAPERRKAKDFTADELRTGVNLEARRKAAQRAAWIAERESYDLYAKSLDRLLNLTLPQLESRSFKIEELILPGAMGESNTPEDLQSYAVELKSDGSFRTIDYLEALTSIRTRNVVQKDVSPQPVDFVAMRDAGGHVLLHSSKDRRVQVSIGPANQIQYAPLDGWKSGLPLRILEDPALSTPSGAGKQAWLASWHSEAEWLHALHRTRYSNGLIGVVEQFLPATSKQRALAQADLLILANDHWNFNVRGFNPGGNHGSFFRISTHSTLMIWGGAKTGVPRGRSIESPYDSLSFVPTILDLLDLPHTDLPGKPIPIRGIAGQFEN